MIIAGEEVSRYVLILYTFHGEFLLINILNKCYVIFAVYQFLDMLTGNKEEQVSTSGANGFLESSWCRTFDNGNRPGTYLITMSTGFYHAPSYNINMTFDRS